MNKDQAIKKIENLLNVNRTNKNGDIFPNEYTPVYHYLKNVCEKNVLIKLTDGNVVTLHMGDHLCLDVASVDRKQVQSLVQRGAIVLLNKLDR